MPLPATNKNLYAVLELRAADPAPAVLTFSQYVETECGARLLAGGGSPGSTA
ncbi:hypothetical protein [Kitasatospora acidiphila]|uniref:hypothetical protein n=1 Tax=Kitasatospora acidiphila TaxID=2567942 RepID=UPI0015F02103|nr:hypothetical protein [Kitasatospora acidiphila]